MHLWGLALCRNYVYSSGSSIITGMRLRSLLIRRIPRILGVSGLPCAVTLDAFRFASDAGNLATVGYEQGAVWVCLQV